TEWCQLPDLNLPAIKAKIDTGARTSALHAFNIKPYKQANKDWVNFEIHPIQYNDAVIVKCKAEVIDERSVMSSNGMKEHRYVISTPLKLGSVVWNIELTLSNRDPLKFRMLLGREALKKHTIIDPNRSFCAGRMATSKAISLYT
ncbi:MAG: RimK/LysX family protein, partial [Pseudomonadota bacterium]|nr:RimK/LysX family protein [Pseudomonadota bacterium]